MSMAMLYLLKVIICSGLLYGYFLLALRNRIFHQWNRLYLIAAVVFSLVFPLVPLPTLFASETAQDPHVLYRLLATEGKETIVVTNLEKQVNWNHLAWYAYSLVALLMLVKLVIGLWQIRRLMLQAKAEQIGTVSFIPTDHASAPFSFFSWLFWKKEIDLDSQSGQSIFRHELVHIREGHSLDKLFMQILLVLFWINPFFWIIRKELHMIHEFIADKKAVGNQGTEALAAMILQSVYGRQHNSLVNPFFQQPIKRRLAMLQKTLKQPRNAYLGRLLTLPLCALLLFAFAKRTTPRNPEPEPQFQPSLLHEHLLQPVADTVPRKTLQDSIVAMSVNKNNGVNTITFTYKNGKKETLTEKQAKERGLLLPPPPPPPSPAGSGTPPPPPPPPPMDPKVLVVVDGKELGTLDAAKSSGKMPRQESYESMNVLKGKTATDKYGEKGKYGVLEITTKKISSTGPVFEKAEQAPQFPGGESAWRAFLQKNMDAGVPVKKGAPAGTYTTMLQFKVGADGTISDLKPLTTHGFGMEEEVLKMMQQSPKWEPAMQNGHQVTAIHKQPITFVIAED